MDETTRLLSRSLRRAFAPDAIASAETLARAVAGDAHDLEASIRIAPGGTARGSRMMMERAKATSGRAIADGLGLPWTDEAEALTAAADALGLPLIVGWDVGGAAPLYKLYANASDASAGHREELHARLEIADSGVRGQIVGLNVSASGVAKKIYVQRESFDALGVSLDVPTALRAARGAAWVASHDVGGQGPATPRAVFVATRHGEEASVLGAFEALVGTAFSELRSAFPFEPGPLRQLGWSPDGSVTAYAKRSGGAAPVHALAPVAVFRHGEVEVGLYVTPSAHTPRAFSRVGDHALTFRTREGAPKRDALEALGAWAAERIEALADAPITAEAFAAPPTGWTRVADA